MDMSSATSLKEKRENSFPQKMSLPKLGIIQEDMARIANNINPDDPKTLIDAGTYFLDAEKKSIEVFKAISYWEKLLDEFEKNSNKDHFKMAKVLPFDIMGKPAILVSMRKGTSEMQAVVNTIANTCTTSTEMVNVVHALTPALMERDAEEDLLGNLDYDMNAIHNLSEENRQIYAGILDFKRSVNDQLYGILQKLKNEKNALKSEYSAILGSKNEVDEKIESMKNDIYEEMILKQRTAFDEAFAENANILKKYPSSMEKIAHLIENKISKEDIRSIIAAKDVRPYFKRDDGEQPRQVKEILTQIHKLGKKKTVSIKKIEKIYGLAEKYIDLQKAEKEAKTHKAAYMNDSLNKVDPYFAPKYRAIDRLENIAGKSANKISALESKIKPIEKYLKRNCGES